MGKRGRKPRLDRTSGDDALMKMQHGLMVGGVSQESEFISSGVSSEVSKMPAIQQPQEVAIRDIVRSDVHPLPIMNTGMEMSNPPLSGDFMKWLQANMNSPRRIHEMICAFMEVTRIIDTMMETGKLLAASNRSKDKSLEALTKMFEGIIEQYTCLEKDNTELRQKISIFSGDEIQKRLQMDAERMALTQKAYLEKKVYEDHEETKLESEKKLRDMDKDRVSMSKEIAGLKNGFKRVGRKGRRLLEWKKKAQKLMANCTCGAFSQMDCGSQPVPETEERKKPKPCTKQGIIDSSVELPGVMSDSEEENDFAVTSNGNISASDIMPKTRSQVPSSNGAICEPPTQVATTPVLSSQNHVQCLNETEPVIECANLQNGMKEITSELVPLNIFNDNLPVFTEVAPSGSKNTFDEKVVACRKMSDLTCVGNGSSENHHPTFDELSGMPETEVTDENLQTMDSQIDETQEQGMAFDKFHQEFTPSISMLGDESERTDKDASHSVLPNVSESSEDNVPVHSPDIFPTIVSEEVTIPSTAPLSMPDLLLANEEFSSSQDTTINSSFAGYLKSRNDSKSQPLDSMEDLVKEDSTDSEDDGINSSSDNDTVFSSSFKERQQSSDKFKMCETIEKANTEVSTKTMSTLEKVSSEQITSTSERDKVCPTTKSSAPKSFTIFFSDSSNSSSSSNSSRSPSPSGSPSTSAEPLYFNFQNSPCNSKEEKSKEILPKRASEEEDVDTKKGSTNIMKNMSDSLGSEVHAGSSNVAVSLTAVQDSRDEGVTYPPEEECAILSTQDNGAQDDIKKDAFKLSSVAEGRTQPLSVIDASKGAAEDRMQHATDVLKENTSDEELNVTALPSVPSVNEEKSESFMLPTHNLSSDKPFTCTSTGIEEINSDVSRNEAYLNSAVHLNNLEMRGTDALVGQEIDSDLPNLKIESGIFDGKNDRQKYLHTNNIATDESAGMSVKESIASHLSPSNSNLTEEPRILEQYQSLGKDEVEPNVASKHISNTHAKFNELENVLNDIEDKAGSDESKNSCSSSTNSLKLEENASQRENDHTESVNPKMSITHDDNVSTTPVRSARQMENESNLISPKISNSQGQSSCEDSTGVHSQVQEVERRDILGVTPFSVVQTSSGIKDFGKKLGNREANRKISREKNFQNLEENSASCGKVTQKDYSSSSEDLESDSDDIQPATVSWHDVLEASRRREFRRSDKAKPSSSGAKKSEKAILSSSTSTKTVQSCRRSSRIRELFGKRNLPDRGGPSTSTAGQCQPKPQGTPNIKVTPKHKIIIPVKTRPVAPKLPSVRGSKNRKSKLALSYEELFGPSRSSRDDDSSEESDAEIEQSVTEDDLVITSSDEECDSGSSMDTLERDFMSPMSPEVTENSENPPCLSGPRKFLDTNSRSAMIARKFLTIFTELKNIESVDVKRFIRAKRLQLPKDEHLARSIFWSVAAESSNTAELKANQMVSEGADQLLCLIKKLKDSYSQYENLDRLIQQYFTEIIIPRRKYVFKNGKQLQNIGRFIGMLCSNGKLLEEARTVLFETMLYRPYDSFAISFGCLCCYPDVFALMSFAKHSMRDQVTIYLLIYHPNSKYKDAFGRFLIKQYLQTFENVLQIPKLAFDPFVALQMSYFKEQLESDVSLKLGARSLTCLLLQNEFDWFSKFVQENFIEWTKEWRRSELRQPVLELLLAIIGDVCLLSDAITSIDVIKGLLESLSLGITAYPVLKKAADECRNKIDARLEEPLIKPTPAFQYSDSSKKKKGKAGRKRKKPSSNAGKKENAKKPKEVPVAGSSSKGKEKVKVASTRILRSSTRNQKKRPAPPSQNTVAVPVKKRKPNQPVATNKKGPGGRSTGAPRKRRNRRRK